MPGRKRKILSLQTGNLTKKAQDRMKYQEKLIQLPCDELESIPEELFTDEVAMKEYHRILENLRKLDFIGNLDRGSMIFYCNAFSQYVRANNAIKAEDFEPIITTRNGTRPNPWYQIQQTALREMDSAGKALGMTVSDRLKKAEGKAQRQEEELESVFGAI